MKQRALGRMGNTEEASREQGISEREYEGAEGEYRGTAREQ